jgi:hypothetical protein
LPSGYVDNNPNSAATLPRSAPSTSTIWRSDDHFILGSYQGVRTLGKLIQKSAGDTAFTSFPTRVSVAMKDLDPENAVVIDETFTVCNYLALIHANANYHCLGWRVPVP